MELKLIFQERIELCEKIIKENEMSFRYVMSKNNMDSNHVGIQAERRLELLGTYILKAVQNDKERPVITEYKEKKIKKVFTFYLVKATLLSREYFYP